MDLRQVNDEVWYVDGRVKRVSRADLDWLKARAAEAPRRRARLCAHPDVDAPLHEMLIVHERGAYVRPHRHATKSESFHLFEGALTVVLFDEVGAPVDHVPMAADRPGAAVYYRLEPGAYHTVVVHSPWVVFHEVTDGPFRREATEFASWAPDEDAPPADRAAYVRMLADWVAAREGAPAHPEPTP